MNRRTSLAALILAAACVDRPGPDAGEEPCIHDVDDQPAPDVPPDDAPPCSEGLTDCFGQCVDIMSNGEHCGECGRPCRNPHAEGVCVDGQCPPTWYCGNYGFALETCEDVCDFYDQRCVENSSWTGDGACHAGYVLYFPEFGYNSMHQCNNDAPSGEQHDLASCSSTIQWWEQGGADHETAGAAKCCCTQDPVGW